MNEVTASGEWKREAIGESGESEPEWKPEQIG
jgi:hypothetical protein